MPVKKPRSKKVKRDIFPTIHPKEQEILSNFDEIVKKARTLDSDLGDSLYTLSNLLGYLRNVPVPALNQYAATEILTDTEACEATGVKFARTSEHRWRLKDAQSLPDAQLSLSIDAVIEQVRKSEYSGSPAAEASVRLIVEFLIRDRLEHLEDKGSLKLLKFWPEVAMQFRRQDTIISGRADWAMCHGDPRRGIESTLVIVEAKRRNLMSSGLPQMIVYLAAVQQARFADHKINTSVFGIITDSDEFKFVFLDSSMKLFVSKVLEWPFHVNKILEWFDRILADAIQASPYTTSVQSRNTTLFAYEAALQQHHLFGAVPNIEETVKANIPPVNIFLGKDKVYQEVDRVRYKGRDLIIVEHESDDDDYDDEDYEDCDEDGEETVK